MPNDPDRREVDKFDGISDADLLDRFAAAVIREDGTRYCGDNKARIVALREYTNEYRVAILRRMGNKGDNRND
ncbi:hypothetical protein LCGC14_2264990 [marine sediment metagenome]|uniref:Uncharacterized protein n=1 Tax=marine sediment metagenome TaxID=412755 RepID=A0A0F9CYL7_9ZZZZ